jgi:hypothetical protein
MAWQALASIGARLNVSRAREAVEIAVRHPVWNAKFDNPNSFSRGRDELVKSLIQLLPALPAEDLEGLAVQVVPLALERFQNPDYAEVVDLLDRLAERGGANVREVIADRLFESGKPVSYLLGQIAPKFGRQFLTPAQLEKAAADVVASISLLVQRLKPGESPLPVMGTVMQRFGMSNEGQVVLTFGSSVELWAIIRHRRSLSATALRSLMSAILVMLQERENPLPNREQLVHGLAGLADSIPEDLIGQTIETLLPIARGVILEPTVMPTAEEMRQPLAFERVKAGRPSTLRGMAYVTLACLIQRQPATLRSSVERTIEDALTDADPEVRRYAIYATRSLPSLSSGALTAVLLGTRDPDPTAASSAFAAIATYSDVRLDESQWRLFLVAVKVASQSSSLGLRRTAARALARLNARDREKAAMVGAAARLADFASDISAEVRAAANWQESEEGGQTNAE